MIIDLDEQQNTSYRYVDSKTMAADVARGMTEFLSESESESDDDAPPSSVRHRHRQRTIKRNKRRDASSSVRPPSIRDPSVARSQSKLRVRDVDEIQSD